MVYIFQEQTLGTQPIANTETTQAGFPLGTIMRAAEDGRGGGEFIYLQGVASTVIGSWVTYSADDGTTTLTTAGSSGCVAIAMSANVANQFGWYQTSGKASGRALTGFLDNADVYVTSTAGEVDDAVVAGDRILNAKGASAFSGGLADFEICRPVLRLTDDSSVTSVFTRTGAVVATSGDYTASEVTNVAAGGIVATEVQAAIDELDTEKAPLASPTFTGTVIVPAAGISGQLANYGLMTHSGATITVSSAGAAVAVIGTTVAKGDANGWTVGTDGTHTATFLGTKTVRIQGVLKLSPIATNTDNLTLHVFVNGSSVFESANNDIDDGTPELYEVDFMADVANGEVVQLFVENEDSTANIVVAPYTDRVNTVASSGWFSVMTV